MEIAELIRLHSSFLIIIGGQLVIFNVKMGELRTVNEGTEKEFTRFPNWMKVLNFFEYMVLIATIYPTFCILIQKVFGKAKFLLPNDNCYVGWYLVSFLVIITIQISTKLNIDYNRKNKKKYSPSLNAI